MMPLAQIAEQPIGAPSMWAQFGLAGLVILALFVVVYVLHRDQRSERTEWREATDRRSDKTDLVIKDMADALRKNTQAVQGISK